MPIPPLNDAGLLPDGIHECAAAEIARRFGSFSGSDRRPRLWSKFTEFLREARASGIIKSLIVDGSFVTATTSPNDIDVIVVLAPDHDLTQHLPVDRMMSLRKNRCAGDLVSI